VAGGGASGPTGRAFSFFSKKIVHQELFAPLSEGAFAGTVALRGLRRELPLAEAFNERKGPFAERILALGEGSVSRSGGRGQELAARDRSGRPRDPPLHGRQRTERETGGGRDSGGVEKTK
jgi:hypothetical protein